MQLRITKGDRGLRALSAAVDQFCSAHDVPDDVRHDLQVVLDEIVNNTVRHAAPRHPQIDMRLVITGGKAEVTIVDDGAAFDPHDAPAPDLTRPVAERRVGGLGIHLVRQLMDDVEYRRSRGKNRLTLRRRLRGPRPARGPASAP